MSHGGLLAMNFDPVYYKMVLVIVMFIFLAFLPAIILDIYYRNMIDKEMKEDAETEKELKEKDQ